MLLVWLLSVCGYGLAQNSNSPGECASPEIVIARYVAAIGGEAALDQVRTLVIDANESEPHTFNPQETAHNRYTFKWRYPNQVVAQQHYFVGSSAFIFDGTGWTNFDGRVSHNEDNTPAWRRKLRVDYPYNDYPSFLMFRVVANPLLLATTKNLYRGFEAIPGPPETCVLKASGTDEWGRERQDTLSFDAKSGFLQTWAIQAGIEATHLHFQFDDYRQAGVVKIPFSIYFDFYKATFRLTKVVPNAALSDTEFVASP